MPYERLPGEVLIGKVQWWIDVGGKSDSPISHCSHLKQTYYAAETCCYVLYDLY